MAGGRGAAPGPRGARRVDPGGGLAGRALALALAAAALAALPRAAEVAQGLLADGADFPLAGGSAPGGGASAVVLGFALDRAGRPSPPLEARVREGVQLLQAGRVDRLVFSGGHPGGGLRGGVSEAEVMKGFAEEALAGAHGARAFGTLEEMIAAGGLHAVHVLTPPDSHAVLARQCLAAGLHVLVEKPVALSGAEAAGLVAAARAADRHLAAGHNFLGLPAYARLGRHLAQGDLGRVSSAEITWALPLGPLRSGPYGLWLMREPRNLLLELGPHLFAFAQDLFGPVEVLSLHLSKPVALPWGARRAQGWRIVARAGAVDLGLTLQLAEGTDDRSVMLRGTGGVARLDYAADTLVLGHENSADLVLNPLLRELGVAWGHLREGVANAARQAGSLNRRSPYAQGFAGMFAAFYGAIRAGRAPDPRFDGVAAEGVMRAIDAALALLPDQGRETWTAPKRRRKPRPTALVIGGTGYLGRDLTRALVARGEDVRVLSRGAQSPFPDLPDRVETCAVSLRDEAGLARAMAGVGVVYNLARALGTTWADCLENDVAVAERIARTALAAGVGRLVYTGTIASYDMSRPGAVITEATPFAADMSDRNLYARSKAECERRLTRMRQEAGLPLTIARPGIVVGRGGPLQHWGIGRWHGAGAVRLWGAGDNPLPFVLIGDVSDALIRMGESRAGGGAQLQPRGRCAALGAGLFRGLPPQRFGATPAAGQLARELRAEDCEAFLKARLEGFVAALLAGDEVGLEDRLSRRPVFGALRDQSGEVARGVLRTLFFRSFRELRFQALPVRGGGLLRGEFRFLLARGALGFRHGCRAAPCGAPGAAI